MLYMPSQSGLAGCILLPVLTEGLFQIPTTGVPGGVPRQKAEHEQADKEQHHNIDNDFQSNHVLGLQKRPR